MNGVEINPSWLMDLDLAGRGVASDDPPRWRPCSRGSGSMMIVDQVTNTSAIEAPLLDDAHRLLVRHGAGWAQDAYGDVCADADRIFGIAPGDPAAADLRSMRFVADADEGGRSTAFHADFASGLIQRVLGRCRRSGDDALEAVLFEAAFPVVMARGLAGFAFDATAMASAIAGAWLGVTCGV